MSNLNSRELTEDEVKDNFLSHIRGTIQYWNSQPGSQISNLEGLAFSILATIDGCAELPGFILAPLPHKDDKQYCIDNDENYYPQNSDKIVNCDIAGELHKLLFKQ